MAYTNIDDNVDDVSTTEWRKQTRNQHNANNLSDEKNNNTTDNSSNATRAQVGKFLDTNAGKRPEMKDHIKSVKQQNRQKSLIERTSGNGNSSGPATIDSTNKQRARSINKSKFVDPDSSLFLDGKRKTTHDKSFTEHLEEKNKVLYH